MSALNIVLIGDRGSDKTQLAKRLAAHHKRMFHLNLSLTVSSTPAATATMGIYCVNLSQKINEHYITDKINKFKKANPDAEVALVGTKSDSQAANIELFKNLKIPNTTNLQIVIPKEDDKTVEKLAIYLLPLYSKTTDNLPWYDALNNFLINININNLSPETNEDLQVALLELWLTVFDKDINLQAEGIKNFINDCDTILEKKHPSIMRSVLKVVAVVCVAIIAGLLAFGIGFALGSWSGPGAFITALMAGSVAAGAVVASSIACGAIGSGLTAFGLFRQSKVMTAVNTFVQETHNFKPTPLSLSTITI